MNTAHGLKILITGCTGTLGQALLRYYLNPENNTKNKIIGISRDEFKQAQLLETLRQEFPDTIDNLELQLADVRDKERLKTVCYDVDIIIHTAALKRIDSVAFSPDEVIKTNVLGTKNVLDAALYNTISKVLFISTDKAVEPTNVYGASKMLAENLVTAFNQYSYPQRTFASVARYGNVWGSRGSFINKWCEIIRETSHTGRNPLVALTHSDMTRFIIRQEEAVEFIQYCLSVMEGGEIFVPDCPSVKILDVYKMLNAQVSSQMKYLISGLRPGGEKLHETLIAQHEVPRTVVKHMNSIDKESLVYTILPYLHPWRETWIPSYYDDEFGKYLKKKKCSSDISTAIFERYKYDEIFTNYKYGEESGLQETTFSAVIKNKLYYLIRAKLKEEGLC